MLWASTAISRPASAADRRPPTEESGGRDAQKTGQGPVWRRSELAGVTKIAILDDYIGVALDYGDWTVLPDDAEITVYRQAIPPERLVDELSDYEIVVITQQRARFPRAVLEGLPNLKLIVCNGRTSNVVDHEARIERGILLCGTAETEQGAAVRPLGDETPRGLPTPSEMAWALILAVAKRIGIEDRAIRAGGWQTGFPIPLAGKTLGLLGAGHLGGAMVPVAKAFGMDVVAWSQNLTEERCAELGVTKSHQGRARVVRGRPRSLPRLLGALAQHAACRRPRQDEARRHPGEHLPRSDRRGGGPCRGAPFRSPRRCRSRRLRP